MPYLRCLLFIFTQKKLEDVATIISEKIFGNVIFGGKDKFIRDEVPAIFIDNILGLRIVLYGYGGEDGYVLEMQTKNFPWDDHPDKKLTDLEVDISSYIAWLLRDVDFFDIETE